MRPSHRKRIIAAGILVVAVIILILLAIFAGRSPRNFAAGTVVTIPDGSSIRQVGLILQQNHIIRSARYFDLVVRMSGNHAIVAGQFGFPYPESVYRVAHTITRGVFGSAQVRVTIPEGSSVVDIAAIVQKQIPSFDTVSFIKAAKPDEGFLFPETYFIFKTITSDDLMARLQSEYQSKITPIEPEIAASGKTELQVITMASILEKEAKNASDAAVISGILWKRIKANLALQVDAPFYYALGLSSSASITAKQLATDGPYNTYTRKGLPFGPIGNPGIAMIEASIHPASSPYWYYLYDKNGQVHYAVTYAQHLQNIKTYLR